MDLVIANAVAGLGATAQKICGDIRHLANWKEIEEPFGEQFRNSRRLMFGVSTDNLLLRLVSCFKSVAYSTLKTDTRVFRAKPDRIISNGLQTQVSDKSVSNCFNTS